MKQLLYNQEMSTIKTNMTHLKVNNLKKNKNQLINNKKNKKLPTQSLTPLVYQNKLKLNIMTELLTSLLLLTHVKQPSILWIKLLLVTQVQSIQPHFYRSLNPSFLLKTSLKKKSNQINLPLLSSNLFLTFQYNYPQQNL